ncbi:MAG: iron-sulfur cluster assembly protein [Polyangiaceae bacterium]|nr:iron-sulfur cluster assembly protein [Polyangiaceae bacterium]
MEQRAPKERRPLGVLNREDPIPQHPVPTRAPDEFVLEDPGANPGPREASSLREGIVQALKTIQDPEIPLNIYDLGLIYDIHIAADQAAHVVMTLTAPGCPVAEQIVRDVHAKLCQVPGVSRAKTELAWEPAWSRDRMSDAAKLELGLL